MNNWSTGRFNDVIHIIGFDDLTIIRNNWIKFTDTLRSIGSSFNWSTSIETVIPNTGNKKYITTIEPNGKITNYFPIEASNTTNDYWRAHNAKVDEALQSRTYLLLKIVQLWEQYSFLNSNMANSFNNQVARKGNLRHFFLSLPRKFRLFFRT